MSSGRYVMRGRVFQGRAFSTWALANSGVVPVYQPAAGVAAGYRSRTFQTDCRARTMQAEFRSRTAKIERGT